MYTHFREAEIIIQQCKSLMPVNGNEGMLTTSTANTSVTTPSMTNSTHQLSAAQVNVVFVGSQCNTTSSRYETVKGKLPNINNITISVATEIETSNRTTAGQRMSTSTLVNGSCNNHNNIGNSSSNNNTNGNKSTTNPCDPEPPPSSSLSPASAASSSTTSCVSTFAQLSLQRQHQQALNPLACSANRITLAECNLNINCNNNSHNNHRYHHPHSHHHNLHQSNIEAALALQQHLLQHHQHQLNNSAQQQNNNCVFNVTAGTSTTTIDTMCPLSPASVTSASLSSSKLSSLSSLSASCSSTNSASITTALSPLSCGYCCQPICDRYIMRVVDTSFHENCLKCATCSLHLVHSCFSRNGKLYCRIDYERQFMRNRCLGCGHRIAADELVMRTLEANAFHLKCFVCVVCGAALKKGEQYVVKQGQLFCRFDYEKEVEMLQGYDFYGDDMLTPKMDGRRGPKRPRTILNTQQRRAFKASFEVSPKPCRKVRENLAKETGLSLRIVQVWFQNQRAKVKKIQKKAKQEGNNKSNCDSQDSQESDNSNMTKIKDEVQSDNESMMDSPYSNSNGMDKLRNCLKDENENAPFNCMETNKENCDESNEPVLNTILGLSYATFQQLMGPFTQTSMINPIDRLYSMQNSYFRPDELVYNEVMNSNTNNVGGVNGSSSSSGANVNHKDNVDS
ncbi:uncharacterized protein ACN427_004593 [Glossina fuscipes fuscipes]